jgi:hypothetical protein
MVSPSNPSHFIVKCGKTGLGGCAASLIGSIFLAAALSLPGMAQQTAESPKAEPPVKGTTEAPQQTQPETKPEMKHEDGSESEQQRRLDAQMQERKNQLAVDTAKLLQLANELKAEMDKSTKDTLSLSVIKKADQVEKLAHKVRDEMKLTIDTN